MYFTDRGIEELEHRRGDDDVTLACSDGDLIDAAGEPLVGRLLRFDALGMRFRETGIRPDPHCPVCAPGVPFPGYIDYAAFCRGG